MDRATLSKPMRISAHLMAVATACAMSFAGCSSCGTQQGWPLVQKKEFHAKCQQVANETYNHSVATGLRGGALDAAAICRCAEAPAMKLFPSFGHWSLALDAATMPPERRWEGIGPYAYVCDKGVSADPILVNWCAEVAECVRPLKERLKPN